MRPPALRVVASLVTPCCALQQTPPLLPSRNSLFVSCFLLLCVVCGWMPAVSAYRARRRPSVGLGSRSDNLKQKVEGLSPLFCAPAITLPQHLGPQPLLSTSLLPPFFPPLFHYSPPPLLLPCFYSPVICLFFNSICPKHQHRPFVMGRPMRRMSKLRS